MLKFKVNQKLKEYRMQNKAGSTQDTLLQGASFRYSELSTVLGTMLMLANENALYLLEFLGSTPVKTFLLNFRKKTRMEIEPGLTQPMESIKEELSQYFEGNINTFQTPVAFSGSDFQQRVWTALKKIPLGSTQSYSDIAKSIGKPLAVRAVANAIGANKHAIIIPCHRVIQVNGGIGGYAGGIEKKQWLLKHELTYKRS